MISNSEMDKRFPLRSTRTEYKEGWRRDVECPCSWDFVYEVFGDSPDSLVFQLAEYLKQVVSKADNG